MTRVSGLRKIAAVLAGMLVAGLTSVATAGPASAAPSTACDGFDQPVLMKINPTVTSSLLTRSLREAAGASRFGFSIDQGIQFYAAATSRDGAVPVQRLYHPKTGDFVALAQDADIAAATAEGYLDQGVRFWASPIDSDCADPVYLLRKDGHFREVATDAGRAALLSDGWEDRGTAFYASPVEPATPTEPDPVSPTDPDPAPPTQPAGSSFTIAVIPDTQQEVLSGTDTRFAERTRWLVDNRAALSLAYVTQTGDMVNWDTPDHEQYARGSAAMKILDDAGIPWSGSIGNHDTAATCPGGSACPGTRPRVTVRNTTTFNQYFPVSRFPSMQGEFEAGKVDNSWSTFEAGGTKWMVLNLELWPRPEVVAWASSVVRGRPDTNVMVVTHSYLNPDGSIYGAADYGQTTPQALFDQLVRPNSNIKIVVSGHVGDTVDREDVRPDGTKVVSYLGAFHSNTTNPVQLLKVDTANSSITRTWAAPRTPGFPTYEDVNTGITWAR